jgi:hypothetical protein
MSTLIATRADDRAKNNRYLAWAAGLFIGIAVVALLTVVLPEDSVAAQVLLDRGGRFPYPFTVQNFMWLIFFSTFAELVVRIHSAGNDGRQTRAHLLPEDDETMLRSEDLAPFASRAREHLNSRNSFLQRLIVRVIWQFQSSLSVSQANEILTSSTDLIQHEIDMRYNMIRYFAWFIPTLGFIGTVIGIALALSTAGNPPDVGDSEALREWMQALTRDLGVAFNTTLVALMLSSVLVLLMHIAQEMEELALNKSAQYCLDNLINRLWTK